MFFSTPLLILLLVPLCFSTEIINYRVDSDTDSEVESCVDRAIASVSEETCLFFNHADVDEPDTHVTFIQSSHCSWQQDNKTVHLSPDCISDDVCFEMLGQVLSVNKPRPHIVRHINLHYNCTEKCTIDCEHGGVVMDDCTCKCVYGFRGERCESLTRDASFTDDSCGELQAETSGHISLSTYPGERKKTTFCQWLIKSADPWTVIDAEVETLGLDDQDLAPGQSCNDHLAVYGTEHRIPSIPCDGSANLTRFHSTSNWLLIELRTNPFTENTFTGPRIRYSTRKQKSGVRVYSEGMTSAASMFFSCSFVTFIIYSL